MVLLALLGMPGSGKSTMAEHLALMGIPTYRLGSTVVSEVRARGLDIAPENEAAVRMELREKYGPAFMARGAIEWAAATDAPLIAFDGVYSVDEQDCLTSEYGDRLRSVAILADKPVRYARLARRPERPLSAAEALSRDRHELDHLHKGDAIALCDHFILNNRSLGEGKETLVRLVDQFVHLTASEYYSELLSDPVAELIQKLRDDDFETHDSWGLSLLMHRGLTEENPLLTWQVCQCLGQHPSSSNIPFLRWVGSQPDLDFETTTLHRVAAWAIGKIGVSASPTLRRCLSDGSSGERSFAADALGEVKDIDSVSLLADRLNRDDWNVALWAALSLAKIGGPTALKALTTTVQLTSESPRRFLAFDALKRIDQREAEAVLSEIESGLTDEDRQALRRLAALS